MVWTPEKRKQLSKMYDINWSRMAKEAQTCNCHKHYGTTSKCSNPKHMFYVKRERELQKLSVEAVKQLR